MFIWNYFFGSDINEASDLNKKGVQCYTQKKYLKAIEYYEKALKIRLEKLGEKHPDVAISYNNLGVVYYSQGNYPKAIEYHEKALEIRLKSLGAKHPYVVESYDNLGGAHTFQGNYPKAMEYYEKALKIRLEKLGAKHPHVVKSYNNLGEIYRLQGNYPKAIEYHKKALEIRLEKLEAKHPYVAESYNNLGEAHIFQGNYPKAIEYSEKALKIRLEKLGEKHPDVAISYITLGEIYRLQENYPKAIEYNKKALKIMLEKPGERHYHVTTSYNNLAVVYGCQGNYPKAIEYHKKALEIMLEKLGEKHPNVAASYNNLGEIYRLQENYPTAIEYHKKALEIILEKLGEKHYHVATSYNNLAVVYGCQGNYPKAIECHKKALEIKLEKLGEKHPDVAISYNNLGLTYALQGNYSKAIEYYEKALKAQPKDPEYRIQRGFVYKEDKNNDKATEDFKLALLDTVRYNKITALKTLHSNGIVLNYRYDNDNSVLHLAADNNRIEIVRYLLEHDLVNCDLQNKTKETALHIAAMKGNLEIVTLLITAGVNVKLKNSSDKSAFSYLSSDQRKKVQKLIQINATRPAIEVLAGNTHHMSSSSSMVTLSNKSVRKMYKQLYSDKGKHYSELMEKYTRSIIQATTYTMEHHKLAIYIDPNRRSVNAVDEINESEGTLGLFRYSGQIVVGALNAKGTEDSAKAIKGTIIHECCHNVANYVFNNDSKPYKKNDLVEAEMFKKICEELQAKKDTKKISGEYVLDPILRRVFTCYQPASYHCELIVRVPQMIAEYGDEGLKKLKDQAPELLSFYENEFLPVCKKYSRLLTNSKKVVSQLSNVSSFGQEDNIEKDSVKRKEKYPITWGLSKEVTKKPEYADQHYTFTNPKNPK